MTRLRRRLDAELVRRGLAPSRARAQEVIAAGQVTVSGAPAQKPDRLVAPGDDLVVHGPGPRFVSRAGEKLDAALDAFAVDVRGARALDVGASTGGFTDCLLQRGAVAVVAVDVGRAQLHDRLRRDARVVSMERTDARTLDAAAIGAPFAVITADVSFIALQKVLPAIVPFLDPTGDLVALVKPQFEAGRGRVDRDGIVRDRETHRMVLDEVAAACAGLGVPVTAVMPSPLRGSEGNLEFLVHCRRDGRAVGEDALVAAVDQGWGAGS